MWWYSLNLSSAQIKQIFDFWCTLWNTKIKVLIKLLLVEVSHLYNGTSWNCFDQFSLLTVHLWWYCVTVNGQFELWMLLHWIKVSFHSAFHFFLVLFFYVYFGCVWIINLFGLCGSVTFFLISLDSLGLLTKLSYD